MENREKDRKSVVTFWQFLGICQMFATTNKKAANIFRCLVSFWQSRRGLTEVCHLWQRFANTEKKFGELTSLQYRTANLPIICCKYFLPMKILLSNLCWWKVQTDSTEQLTLKPRPNPPIGINIISLLFTSWWCDATESEIQEQ